MTTGPQVPTPSDPQPPRWLARGLAFGGDYNPEQWPREIWREDVDLMRAAGVNLVTVGVFSWSTLEPEPGHYQTDWLTDVLDLLHEGGIAVDLATPTASPPPWLAALDPTTRPVTADGVRLDQGSRNLFSASSALYRERALAITRVVAERFHSHPAVAMWHVGNELGQVDYSDVAAAAFRRWLQARYGSIEGLNQAWATTVWSQRYRAFEEVCPPRATPYHHNPAQVLDFRRFTSDELRSLYREQRDLIRQFDPIRPITTNFMGFFPLVDYRSWEEDVDVVADDAYPDPADPNSLADAALTQDLMRGLGQGRPWLLMESAASAVSWREHNLTKSPARVRLESLQAVAHGADGICFFQWRQARSGPERFHSALLPLAGPDTAVHRGVVNLGRELARLAPLVGRTSPAQVAVIWDWPSWWAGTGEGLPTRALDPLQLLRSWHRALWRLRVPVDVVGPEADLAPYRLVLAPSLYLIDRSRGDHLTGYVRDGGVLAVGPFSGVAGPDTTLHTGLTPAFLTSVLGVGVEEHVPLPDGVAPAGLEGTDEPLALGVFAGHTRSLGATGVAVLPGAEALPGLEHLAGAPIVTRHHHGSGEGWLIAATLTDDGLLRVLARVLASAGVQSLLPGAIGRLEVTRRGGALFVLNHGPEPARIPGGDLTDALDLPSGTALLDLLTEQRFEPDPAVPIPLPPNDVLVLTEAS